jgi:methylated-DNA-[protein]-cysteine S-methyltransferase
MQLLAPPIRYRVVESGLGTFVLFARTKHLSRLDLFCSGSKDARTMVATEFPDAVEAPGMLCEVKELLRRYVTGERVHFTLPVDLTDLKPFTARVLTAIRKIPYGRLASYGMIGRSLGYHNAAQAVGQALKRNPVPIVIPCHRVIRGDGSLGGFDMGPDMKTRLLSLEGIHVREMHKSMILS